MTNQNTQKRLPCSLTSLRPKSWIDFNNTYHSYSQCESISLCPRRDSLKPVLSGNDLQRGLTVAVESLRLG